MGEKTMQSLADRLIDLDEIIHTRNQGQNELTEIDTYTFVETMKNKNTVRNTKGEIKKLRNI